MPENEKAAEGVPAKENEGQTSAPKPSTPEKMTLAPLKTINENVPSSDDVQPMEISNEEYRENPQEPFPLFPAEYVPNGPVFNEQLHLSKLEFFGKSPYEGERTSLSPRFWTKEQAVYYARILFGKNKIFNHKILNFTKLEKCPVSIMQLSILNMLS